MSNIYTRSGDQGKTKCLDGACVDKNNPIIILNGMIDECNSIIGVIRSFNNDSYLNTILKNLQIKLFIIGSEVSSRGTYKPSSNICKSDIDNLEHMIDKIDNKLEKLAHFILPAGGVVSAHLHLARSISRKIERQLANLQEDWLKSSQLQPYFNRLSDAFFILARYATKQSNEIDEIWKDSKI